MSLNVILQPTMKYKAAALLIAAILHSVSTLRKWNELNHHKTWKNDNEVTNLKIEYGVTNLRDHINLEIQAIPRNHGAHKNLLKDYDYYYNWNHLSSQKNYQPYSNFRYQYYRIQPASEFSLRNYDDIYVQNQAGAIVTQRIPDQSITRYGNSAHSTYNNQNKHFLGLHENQVLRHNPYFQNNEIQSAVHQPTNNDYDHYIPSDGNITITEPHEDTVISPYNAEEQNPDYPALGNSPNNHAEDNFYDDQVPANIISSQHPSDQNKADTDSYEIDENYMILGPYEQPPRKVSKEEGDRSSEVVKSSKSYVYKNISSPSDYEYYDMDLYHDIITPFSHEDFNHLNKTFIHSHQHFGSDKKNSKAKFNNVTGLALGLPEIYSHTQQKMLYRPHLDPHKQPVSSQYNSPPKNPYPYQVPPRNIQNPHYTYQPQPPQLSQVIQSPPFDPHDPFSLYNQPTNQNIVPYNTNAQYKHGSQNPAFSPYDPASNRYENMYSPLSPYPPLSNAPYQPLTAPLSTVLNLSPNIHTDEDDCEYGTSWTMNCYHCVCNGSTATCIRDNNCKSLPSHVQNEPKLCKPFTQFPLDGSDCHRCHCTADGIPLCTFDYYACNRKTKQRFYKLQGENILKIGLSSLNDSLSTTTMICPALLMYFNVWKCQPSSRWTARCFNCACDDYGQPICYRIVGCTPAPLSMPPKCRPGTTIPMKDCIDCYCDDDGFPAGQLPPPKSSGLSGAGTVIKGKESPESKEKADSSEESEEIGLGKDVLPSLTAKTTTFPEISTDLSPVSPTTTTIRQKISER